MDNVNVDFIDLVSAILLASGITELIKQILKSLLSHQMGPFTPLIVIVASAVSVGLLIDLQSATQQDFALAVTLVTLNAVGIHSTTKNVGQGVRDRVKRRRET